MILDDNEGVTTEHYYSDVDSDDEEEETEVNGTVATSPEEVVDEVKFTGLSGGDSHQEGVMSDNVPALGQVVNMQNSDDISEQLINGAVVEISLEGPTQLDSGPKYQSYDEEILSHPMYTPHNSPSLGSSIRRNPISRSVSVDHPHTVVSPFRKVRSASVGNRTTYKIGKPHTNINWDLLHESV